MSSKIDLMTTLLDSLRVRRLVKPFKPVNYKAPVPRGVHIQKYVVNFTGTEQEKKNREASGYVIADRMDHFWKPTQGEPEYFGEHYGDQGGFFNIIAAEKENKEEMITAVADDSIEWVERNIPYTVNPTPEQIDAERELRMSIPPRIYEDTPVGHYSAGRFLTRSKEKIMVTPTEFKMKNSERSNKRKFDLDPKGTYIEMMNTHSRVRISGCGFAHYLPDDNKIAHKTERERFWKALHLNTESRSITHEYMDIYKSRVNLGGTRMGPNLMKERARYTVRNYVGSGKHPYGKHMDSYNAAPYIIYMQKPWVNEHQRDRRPAHGVNNTVVMVPRNRYRLFTEYMDELRFQYLDPEKMGYVLKRPQKRPCLKEMVLLRNPDIPAESRVVEVDHYGDGSFTYRALCDKWSYVKHAKGIRVDPWVLRDSNGKWEEGLGILRSLEPAFLKMMKHIKQFPKVPASASAVDRRPRISRFEDGMPYCKGPWIAMDLNCETHASFSTKVNYQMAYAQDCMNKEYREIRRRNPYIRSRSMPGYTGAKLEESNPIPTAEPVAEDALLAFEASAEVSDLTDIQLKAHVKKRKKAMQAQDDKADNPVTEVAKEPETKTEDTPESKQEDQPQSTDKPVEPTENSEGNTEKPENK